jgi:hypothetical protein
MTCRNEEGWKVNLKIGPNVPSFARRPSETQRKTRRKAPIPQQEFETWIYVFWSSILLGLSCRSLSTDWCAQDVKYNSVGFEVFTMVTMNSTIFWVVMPSCSVVYRRFVLIYFFHPHGWLPAWLPFRPWKWKQYVPSKRWETSTGLYGITSHTTVIYRF